MLATQNVLSPVQQTETGNLSLNLVKQLDERINLLKNKLKQKKTMRIDMERFNRIRDEDYILILKMMNFEVSGLWNSCRDVRKRIMDKFNSMSNKIVSEFESIYKSILSLKSKKLLINSNKNNKKSLILLILEIMFDLFIDAEIITKICDKTVCLLTLNGYHFSKDYYKNIYQFDLKKANTSTYWVIKEYTYVSKG